VPKRLAAIGRRSQHVVVGNGPGFASKAVDRRVSESGVSLRFIYLGKLMQNAYVESFSGKFRDKRLSQHWFISLEEARSVGEEWRVGLQRAASAPQPTALDARGSLPLSAVLTKRRDSHYKLYLCWGRSL
jgi:hypothetical protein